MPVLACFRLGDRRHAARGRALRSLAVLTYKRDVAI
jgi:hypothetical protein